MANNFGVTVRFDNDIAYISPRVGGFQAELPHAMGGSWRTFPASWWVTRACTRVRRGTYQYIAPVRCESHPVRQSELDLYLPGNERKRVESRVAP